MQLTIEPKFTHATMKAGTQFSGLLIRLEGRKHWPNPTTLRFETSEHNLRVVRELFPEVEEQDRRPVLSAMEAMLEAQKGLGGEKLPSDNKNHPMATAVAVEPNFRSKPFAFQLVCFDRFKNSPVFALFSEQGTGKSKTFIDIICHKWLTGQITGVCILAWPKGVHSQWIDQQLPEHIWDNVKWRGVDWNGKKFPDWVGKKTPGELQIITGNIEMVNFDKGRLALEPFLKLHGTKGMLAVDESQTIKTPGWRKIDKKTGQPKLIGSKRTIHANDLGELVGQRAIMTGTPIAKDIVDEWSQFRFLDHNIIGHKYLTSFRAQYCIMGGWENRSVVGHRNMNQFNRLVAPYIFRATKAEDLDLPEKLYDELHFDLSDEQKRHQKSMKENFLTFLDSGQLSSVANAAGMIIRLQQLACGYLVADDGTVSDLKANPRIDALRRITNSDRPKTIIWCRFNRDIQLLKEEFKEQAVTYYGPTSIVDRKAAIERFMDADSGVKYFVANPAAAGSGLNLQGPCRTAIYYSNSFNAIDRWQSEDRIHRIGTTGNVTYFDLVGRGSVDRKILTNLRNKKSFSDMVLSEVRSMIEELF